MNEPAENPLSVGESVPVGRRTALVAVACLATSLMAGLAPNAHGQESAQPRSGGEKSGGSDAKAEQEVLALSKDKWGWMSERKVDALEKLFHEKAVFVHMGG